MNVNVELRRPFLCVFCGNNEFQCDVTVHNDDVAICDACIKLATQAAAKSFRDAKIGKRPILHYVNPHPVDDASKKVLQITAPKNGGT